jgi:membrane-bound inhibitor of C-type lysozyme
MYNSQNMAATATLVVARGRTELGIVNINKGATSAVLTLYDDVSAVAANVIATIDATATGCYVYGRACSRGITAVLSGGNADVTISHG